MGAERVGQDDEGKKKGADRASQENAIAGSFAAGFTSSKVTRETPVARSKNGGRSRCPLEPMQQKIMHPAQAVVNEEFLPREAPWPAQTSKRSDK